MDLGWEEKKDEKGTVEQSPFVGLRARVEVIFSEETSC